MKIIASLGHLGATLAAADWSVLPDSCWLLSRRPLFVPRFEGGLLAFPALAIKTGRIGKTIAMRFAPRYFAGFAPALTLIPRAALDMARNGIIPPARMLCFDNSVVLGDWQSRPSGYEIRYSAQDVAETLQIPSPDLTPACRLLADASASMTVKTGDVIIIPLSAIPFNAVENSRIEIVASDSDSPEKSSLLLTNFK